MKSWIASILAVFTFSSESRALGLRNFRQLEGHYSSATGVPTSNYNVRTIANQVASALPEGSALNDFSSGYVRAASALSAVYCLELVNREVRVESAARRCHGLVDFSQPPQSQTDAVIAATLTSLANYLWLRSPTALELTALLTSANTLKMTVPADGRGTKRLYVGLCSLLGSSVQSLVIRN